MSWSEFVRRGKKALRMPPEVLWGRLQDEVRQQTKRPWANVYPHVLRDATLIARSATDLASLWDLKSKDVAWFARPEDRERWTVAFRERYPASVAQLITAADAVVRHEFDLLGSGPVKLDGPLPWLCDFKTGREWPLKYHRDIEYLELERPSDVKVPWELSRAQHFTTLGQAFWLSGDEKYAREFVEQVEHWLSVNPLGYGVNWACAMDVALRAISWIWGFAFMAQSRACASDDFRRRMLRSLFMHGEFIARNLETSDINGNHYLSDAAGLVAIGAFFAHTPDGQRWLSIGQRIVADEILLQVYPDGVDHEGSTPYHRLVLELFLFSYILLERAGRVVPTPCVDRLEKMCDFVAAYTKPSGLAPLIGDADDGRVHKLGLQELNDHRYLLSTASVYCRSDKWTGSAGHYWDESFWLLGPDGASAFDALKPQPPSAASAAFPDGGFYILRNQSAHVIVDCGEVGMRGRGGHGHNDALSFELYMNGINAITDCGAFVYTASREWRNKFRSTEFHNTVQVDGEEVNRFIEPNALWQLRDDARPEGLRFDLAGTGGYWEGGHTGYLRLAQQVLPRRAIWLHPEQPLLAIRDVVSGDGRHQVTWRWHFDPACRVTLEGGGCRIVSGDRALWFQFRNVVSAQPRLEQGWVSRSYGVKHPAAVMVLDADDILPMRLDYVIGAEPLSELQQVAAMSALEAAANVK